MEQVLVTGASGFIAKHIVRELLEQGFSVRASVRSDASRAQVRALFPDADLEFTSLDLRSDAGWDTAMEGMSALIHTASPFPAAMPRDRDDLIGPAVDGTRRALTGVARTGVPRVVVTSSVAAIYKDAAKPRSQRATRDQWTDPDGPDTNAYEASKTLAERAAWEVAAEHPALALTAVNPGAVFGPPMDSHHGTSLGWVERYASGRDPLQPKSDIGIVDVRDVARIHVRALSTPATVGKRYPANAGALTYTAIASILREAFPDRRISTREAPDWVVRLVAAFDPSARPVLGNLAGRTLDVDGSDAPADMGFDYIPARDALLASAEHLIAHGA